jgi:hypothetical protein
MSISLTPMLVNEKIVMNNDLKDAYDYLKIMQ